MNILSLLNEGAEYDRVRRNSSAHANEVIDKTIESNIRRFSKSSPEEITERIRELDREWDIERILETMAPSFALFFIFMGATSHHWYSFIFKFMSCFVLTFLLIHAIQGWCPPIPVLRNFGIRTRSE